MSFSKTLPYRGSGVGGGRVRTLHVPEFEFTKSGRCLRTTERPVLTSTYLGRRIGKENPP